PTAVDHAAKRPRPTRAVPGADKQAVPSTEALVPSGQHSAVVPDPDRPSFRPGRHDPPTPGSPLVTAQVVCVWSWLPNHSLQCGIAWIEFSLPRHRPWQRKPDPVPSAAKPVPTVSHKSAKSSHLESRPTFQTAPK